MKTFHRILLNNLLATVTTNFLWFALVFWTYLETKSVIASSVVGATYPLLTSVFGILFGTFVDKHKKKTAMLVSSIISISVFTLATLLYFVSEQEGVLNLRSPIFWIFVLLIMIGAVASNLRMIAISTLVTILVPKKNHDKANGLVGTVNGISFAITSIFSGLAIAYLGMGWSLVLGTTVTLLVIIHLLLLEFKDEVKKDSEVPIGNFDFKGSIAAIKEVPGLSSLIVFSMLNNFFGGVFFALMDPYGLELVSVEIWGLIWGGLSSAFIIGGILVAKRGLGPKPLRVLFITNMLMWIIGMLFPIKESIVFTVVGMFFYMILIPRVEAAEQTLLQTIVPMAKQGRVFGFAQTVENMVSPVSALLIGPLTQAVIIPFMTTGTGAEILGPIYGTGVNRAIGLVFMTSSFVGLLITVYAFRSRFYDQLSGTYEKLKGKVKTQEAVA